MEVKELFTFYANFFTYYSKAVDLIRRTMACFPPRLNKAQTELLLCYNKVDESGKKQILRNAMRLAGREKNV